MLTNPADAEFSISRLRLDWPIQNEMTGALLLSPSLAER